MVKRTCMKSLMTVDEAMEVYQNCSVWRDVVCDYPSGQKC